jgi:hypothetical protein
MPRAEAAGDPEAARAKHSRSGDIADTAGSLEHGRQAYARREWLDAYESLARADQTEPLRPDDLELLATSASMLGRDSEYVGTLERAHQANLDAGQALRAARCAFWVGTHLAIRGEMGGAACGPLRPATRAR